MLNAISIVDKVVLDREGIILVRLQKIVMRGDRVLGFTYHGFGIMPGTSPDYYFDGVGAHLEARREGRPDEANSWGKVRRWTDRFHDAAAAELNKERRRQRKLGEDPDAERDGEIVFDAMGALYDTPAAPRGRVDRVIAANPAILLAGREPLVLSKVSIEPGEKLGSPKTLRDWAARVNPELDESGLEEVAQAGSRHFFNAIAGAIPADEEIDRLNAAVAAEHTPEVVKSFRAAATAQPVSPPRAPSRPQQVTGLHRGS